MVDFSCRPFPNILEYRDHQRDLPTIWKTRLFQTYIEEFSYCVWEFRLTVFENNHWNTIRTGCLWWIKVRYDFFSHLQSYWNIMQFQISSRRETDKEIPESSRSEFLEKFLENNFPLSEAEDNIWRPLNSRGIADLPFLRALWAICKKSQEPSSWEVMDSFVLVAYASLAASRTILQWFLACLNFTLDSEDLFCWYKWKKKKISMNYGSSTSWEYIHEFQPEPTHKIH